MHYFEYVPEISEILSLNPKGSAFLFDMDGTLINTEGLHAKAFMSLLDPSRSSLAPSQERLYEMCLGQTDERIFNILNEHQLLDTQDIHSLRARKNSNFIEQLKEVTAEEICLPAIGALLEQIKSLGHKIALVTSSDHESASASMKQMGFLSYFDAFITEESTERNKPHPDPYILACKNLSSSPESCFVFEDSPTGLAAAKDFAPGAIIHACWY